MEASPMGLWDILNSITIFTHCQYSFAACLASDGLCPAYLTFRVNHRLSMVRYATGTATEFDSSGIQIQS